MTSTVASFLKIFARRMAEPATLSLSPSDAPAAVLVTGAAGFIGYHLALHLIHQGLRVVGYDIVNDYYDPALKEARLASLAVAAHAVASGPGGSTTCLTAAERWQFVKGDLVDLPRLTSLFQEHSFGVVVHLAAQAGVRYSITNPAAYISSNLVGFANILELCKNHHVKHLVYASSSSVYGGNRVTPFSESHGVDHPVSLYAATKKSNELMAHSYSHLFQLPTTGLRFFTVYGPWGRPDMAVASFTKNILQGVPIELFNHGNMLRDFTYVDDIVEGIVRVMQRPPTPQKQQTDGDNAASNDDPGTSSTAPYRVFNIGNSSPQPLLTMVATLEEVIGVGALKVMKPMQPGDVLTTAADTSRLELATGFAPRTSLRDGLTKYVQWYRGFYGPSS